MPDLKDILSRVYNGPASTAPRFTPEMLKAGIAAGLLTTDDINKMDPRDQEVAVQMMPNVGRGPDGMVHQQRPAGEALADTALTVGGGLAGGMLPAAAAVKGGKYVGATLQGGLTMGAVKYGLQKLGVPSDIADMIALGGMLGHGGSAGKGAPGPIAAEEAAAAEGAASAAPRLPSFQERPFPETPQAAPSLPSFGRNNVTKGAPDFQDIESRVVGGGVPLGNQAGPSSPPAVPPLLQRLAQQLQAGPRKPQGGPKLEPPSADPFHALGPSPGYEDPFHEHNDLTYPPDAASPIQDLLRQALNDAGTASANVAKQVVARRNP